MTAPTGTFPEIPFFDLRVEEEDLEAVAETLRSGWLTMGPRTEKFEGVFADYVGARHAVALSSCTAALHLAYLGAGVGEGDEVIVPAFTFAAPQIKGTKRGPPALLTPTADEADQV